jgi:tetratricopeptide (TPR) repeat protein
MKKVLSSIPVLAAILLLVCSFQLSFGQQALGKETLGIDYFQQGNFEKALPIFAKLAQSYPDNAMYNYYYGVCLIKNNIFETAAKEALLNSVVDKTPVNANFYLAIYFHALENWQEAKGFYDRYEKVGSRQEKKSLRFDYYVDLCKQKNNPFKPVKTVDTSLFGDTLLKPPPKIDEKNFPIPEALKKAWFNFQVNEILAYHSIDDFRSEASKILFTKAWICTGKNDSLVALTDSLRKVHDIITRVDTRLGIVQQIVDCEQKSYQLTRDREKFLDQSRVKESAYWEREGVKAATAYNATILERENKLNQDRINEEKLRAKTQETEIVPIPEVKKDTVVSQPVAPRLEVSEKNTEVEEQVYRVQIGSFKNGVLSPSFKTLYAKISKLRKVDKFTDAKKYVVYTIGNFTNSADAVKMKDQLVQEGMKGAKVVSFNKGGEKVAKTVLPLTAKKEAAKTVAVAPASPSANTSDKSAPVGNLIFRVQISSLKNGIATPAFNKIYARISKLYKVDKYMDSRNYEIYTVGEFVGYPEATRMKNEMIQQGIKDAFIAAFHNGERIKVSEALKLAGGK